MSLTLAAILQEIGEEDVSEELMRKIAEAYPMGMLGEGGAVAPIKAKTVDKLFGRLKADIEELHESPEVSASSSAYILAAEFVRDVCEVFQPLVNSKNKEVPALRQSLVFKLVYVHGELAAFQALVREVLGDVAAGGVGAETLVRVSALEKCWEGLISSLSEFLHLMVAENIEAPFGDRAVACLENLQIIGSRVARFLDRLDAAKATDDICKTIALAG